MSVDKTFTVTVAYADGGNRYFIDGVQQDTIMIGAGLTYKFDQSDNTNNGHPLRFATAADAAGGTEYTIGVTTSGVPGYSGAYTQIDVQDGAPSTLYYYCTQHNGMGGEANTDGWGRSNFGQADWGDTNLVLSGWGRLGWGDQAYGDAPTVTLAGQSATSSVGEVTVVRFPGWGTLDWGENGWGSVESATEPLTAPSAMTSSVGAITPADVVGLTGQGATSSVGAPTIILSPTISLTGQAATSSVGSISLDNMQVGLTGQAATSGVGAITPADVVGITGLGLTSSVGTILTNAEDLIDVTGVGATSAVGSLVTEVGYTLASQLATTSVGTITPADVQGLEGQEAVSAVGTLGIKAYGDIVITGNTSYNDVDVVGNTSYTDVNVA